MGKILGILCAAAPSHRVSRLVMNVAACAFMLICTLGISQQLHAQSANESETASSSKSKLLILKNGETLRGDVTPRDGDRVEIRMASGSKIVLAASSIDFVTDSLEDAYWQRVARTRASDLGGQIKLFRWCIVHGLFEQARNQFNIAQELEVSGVDLARMATELEIAESRAAKLAVQNQDYSPSTSQEFVASLLDDSKPIAIRPLPTLTEGPDKTMHAAKSSIAANWNSSPPSIPSSPNQVGTIPASVLAPIDIARDSTKRIPKSMSPRMQMDSDGNWTQISEPKIGDSSEPIESPATDRVAQVAFEQELAEESADRYPTLIPAHQLDRETRAMPRGTLGMFKRTIEPILIRNCYECHRGDDETLPLIRLAAGRTIPRRMSQRNLHHLMRHVDREDPLNSQALQMAVTAHGGQEKSSLNPSSGLVASLRTWLVEVSNDPIRWRPLVYQIPATETAEVENRNSAELSADSDSQTGNLSPQQSFRDSNDSNGSKIDQNGKTISSADPFDPAVFNSQSPSPKSQRTSDDQ